MLEHENQARNRTTKDAKVFNELKSTELLISRLNCSFSSFARSPNKTTSYTGKAFKICIVSHFTMVQADFKLRCYVYTVQFELLEGGVKNTVVDWEGTSVLVQIIARFGKSEFYLIFLARFLGCVWFAVRPGSSLIECFDFLADHC